MTSELPRILDELTGRTEQLAEQVLALCEIESPSEDLDSLRTVTDFAAELGTKLLGRPPVQLTEQGRPGLLWEPDPGGVLILGHLDTVWPLGTLARWPKPLRANGRISAPGVFDMKAGVVQAFHAAGALGAPSRCGILLTTDEEIGSPVFRPVIERIAAGLRAVFVPEASADGALKTGRKGTSMYVVRAIGKAAHAGLEPEKGVNALLELANQVRTIATFGAGSLTVTPTLAGAGTTSNTVPAEAFAHVDVRATTIADQEALDQRMHALQPTIDGATVLVEGGPNRPPLEPALATDLFTIARDIAATLGFPPLNAVSVGGASDGNFTAGIGVPTLDGLGAVGEHAHAEGEYAIIAEFSRRAALLAGLIEAVTA